MHYQCLLAVLCAWSRTVGGLVGHILGAYIPGTLSLWPRQIMGGSRFEERGTACGIWISLMERWALSTGNLTLHATITSRPNFFQLPLQKR